MVQRVWNVCWKRLRSLRLLRACAESPGDILYVDGLFQFLFWHFCWPKFVCNRYGKQGYTPLQMTFTNAHTLRFARRSASSLR
jgi:hypothetical protein